MHTHACNVLVRLLEHVQQQQLQNVMHQISSSVGKLAQDRYGSYVLQHIMIMENGTIADRRKMIVRSAMLCSMGGTAREAVLCKQCDQEVNRGVFKL